MSDLPDNSFFPDASRSYEGSMQGAEDFARPYHQTWRDKIGQGISDAVGALAGPASGRNMAMNIVGTEGLGGSDGTKYGHATSLGGVLGPNHFIDAGSSIYDGDYKGAALDGAQGLMSIAGLKGAASGIKAFIDLPFLKHAPETFEHVVTAANGMKAVVYGSVNGNTAKINGAFGMPSAAGYPHINEMGLPAMRSVMTKIRDEYPYARTLEAIRISGARHGKAASQPADTADKMKIRIPGSF
jgi:hypothetical protein